MSKDYGDILAQELAKFLHAPVDAQSDITNIPVDDCINGMTVKAISEGTTWTYVAASSASSSSSVIVPSSNPSTGRWLLDFATLASSVAALAAQGTYACASDLAAGDWVYISASGTVAKADADDTSKLPCIGVIVSKPTSTTCVVQTTGQVTLSGLTAGSLYYLSATAGAITTTAPSANAIPVGVAKTTTVLVIGNCLAGAGDLTIRGKANVATSLGVGATPLAAGIATAGPVKPGVYTVSTLPAANTYTGGLIWVSDASGGAKPCISDGSNWKIVTLGSTVS